MSSRIRPELSSYLVIFAACSIILLVSVVLTPVGGKDASLALAGQIRIPETCIFKNLTGLPCPGCGLTHAFTEAVRGDFTASLRYHRLGLPILFYIFLQFVLSLSIIVIRKYRSRLLSIGYHLNKGLIVLAALLLINWIFTLIPLL